MEQYRSRPSVLSKARGSLLLLLHGLRNAGSSLGPIHRPPQHDSRPPAHGGPQTSPPPPSGMGGDYPEQGPSGGKVREARSAPTNGEAV